MKKLIILFTALTLFAGCQSLTNKSGNSSVIEISSDELRKEFSKSKDSVYSKYNGKELIVSGKVNSKGTFEQADLQFGTFFETGELKGVPPVFCLAHDKFSKTFDEIKENSETKVRGYFYVQDSKEFLVLKGCQIDSKAETKTSAPMTETLDAETLAHEYAKSKTEFIDKYYGKELNIKGKNDLKYIGDTPEKLSTMYLKAGSNDEKDLPFFICLADFQHKKALEPLEITDAVTVKGRLFITKRLHPGSDTIELMGCEITSAK